MSEFNFPTEFASELEPLPMCISEAADAAIERLAERGFKVLRGLTTEAAAQVRPITLQQSIGHNCHKDRGVTRFATEGSTATWLTKGIPDGRHGRDFYGLYLLGEDPENLTMAGYGWTGPELCDVFANLLENQSDISVTSVDPYLLESANVTWAERISEEFQGQGLAAPFGTLITAGTRHFNPGVETIWLDTWGSNGPAFPTYSKIGFVYVPEADHPAIHQTANGDRFDDVRLHMVNTP